MKTARHFICKKTAYRSDGSRLFEARQKYIVKKCSDGDLLVKIGEGHYKVLKKEYFKEHFKMQAE